MKRISKAHWIWCQFQDTDMCFLEKLQSEVNNKFKGPSFEVHMTLLGPFAVMDEHRINKIESICRTLKPIKVIPKCYDFDDKFFMAFYVKLKQTQPLLDFRSKFFDLDPILKKSDYLPHISLTYGNFSSRKKETFINQLVQLKKNFLLSKVCIVNVDEAVFSWKIIRTFKL